MALFALFAIHLLMIKINYIETLYQFQQVDPFFEDYESTTEEMERLPSPDLYGILDKAIIPFVSYELEEAIYNSSTAWLIHFYDSRKDPPYTSSKTFSTFWKQLATSISNWQEIVRVGVFDCFDDQTTDFQICDKYRVLGFSTVRYFPPLQKDFISGNDMSIVREDSTLVAPAWRTEIIKHLQNTKNKPLDWPDFSPLSSDEEIESALRGKNVRILVLVVEGVESFAGRELIMDLYGENSVKVRFTNERKFTSWNRKLPQVLVIKSDVRRSRKHVILANTTRAGIYESVRYHLEYEGYIVPQIVFDVRLDEENSFTQWMYPKPLPQCTKTSSRKKKKDPPSFLSKLIHHYAYAIGPNGFMRWA